MHGGPMGQRAEQPDGVQGGGQQPVVAAVGRGGQHGQRIRTGLDFFANQPHVPEELLELPIDADATLGSGTRQTREALTRAAVNQGARVRAATRS